MAAGQTQIEYFPLKGGLDVVSPSLAIPAGALIDCQNYEPEVTGGYRRINGYERFDGRPAPSDAIYYLGAVTITGTINVGNTVTGVTSSATGVVVYKPTGKLLLTKVTGTFQNGETLNVSAAPQGTLTSAMTASSEGDLATHADYANRAADVYRADIQAVPGTGAILGVHLYNGVVYAFRTNAGDTATDMYKSTTGGWSKVDLNYEVSFTAASGSVDDGDTLTEGGVTATVKRVVIQSGTLAGGTAAGRLIISAPAGGNFSAGAATTTGGGALTLSGAQTAITLVKNGRFEFVNYNFGGSTTTQRMYGCDGKNRAFEFDGTTFVPIATGMTADTPSFISAHKGHLFLAFGASLQHSSTGNPYQWTPLTGASELAVGDTITGLLPQHGSETSGALVAFSANSTRVLYGTSTADWNLVTLSDDSGAVAYTCQNLVSAFRLDDRGIAQLNSTVAYGNFEHAFVSRSVQPLIDAQRGKATASCVVRKRNQYRVFYSNNKALLYAIAGDQTLGFMWLDYGRVVRCISTGEDATGKERVFFGSDDGYVYEDGKGTSFDGGAIEAWVRTAFNHVRSPQIRKRYRRAVLDVNVTEYAALDVSYELGYGSQDVAAGTTAMVGGGGYWDQFYWDQFTWDTQYVADARLDLTGTAQNINLLFYSNSDLQQPHTLQGVILHYTPRRLER